VAAMKVLVVALEPSAVAEKERKATD